MQVNAETITVSSFDQDFCAAVVAHVPAQGVEHRPGAEPGVAPPDLYGTAPPLVPQEIEFPLTLDLARDLGVDLPEGMEMTAPLGRFRITGDGKVYYNEQDLTRQAESFCASGAPQDLAAPPADPGGHAPDDVIKSQAPENTKNQEIYGAYPDDRDASPAEAGKTQNGD